MEVSLKLQETIKKSLLVRSGSPAVYHLKPKKEIIGDNMTKLTVGEKDLKKTNRTVLLVGETGAGKSTLINALVNYTMGVKWEDDVWFQMVVEDGAEGGNQAESQTSDVVVYQIFGFEDQTLPYSLTLIDTPGFGDTRGIEHDATVSHKLSDLFCSKDGVHEVDVVGLVLKSSEKQVSDRQSNIFDLVASLFGKDLNKNIVALITHSDGITPENVLQALEEAKIKVAKDEEGETIHFLFNNLQSRQRTKKETGPLKFAWELSTGGMSQFQDFLEKTAPIERLMGTEQKKTGAETNAGVQSKYDHITCKVLVQSGSPSIYKLTPKKEMFQSHVTKFTVGEKDPEKTNRTVLLVGETGAGKSALIDALVNYTMGVKWKDNVWFQVVDDGDRSQSESKTESQTSDVVVYQIFGFEGQTLPYSLTLIDTPGYGDTEGIDKDVIINQRLLDLFRSDDGVHKINVVGLVLTSAVNRLTERQLYIFDSMLGLFGKDMEKNIVALITHSNGKVPHDSLKALKDANITLAMNERNQPVYFLFDNCKAEDRTEEEEEPDHAYKVSTKGMSQFTDFLFRTKAQKLDKTVKVLNERIRLTACIHNLQERVQFIELKQREIKQKQEALDMYELELKNNEKFSVEVEEVYKDKEKISGGRRWWWLFFYKGATCCTVCEENCHYPGCTVFSGPSSCEVMKGGRCTSCTKKCPVSKHVKEEWRYVTKTRKVKKTLEEMKSKYEKGQKGKLDEESLLKELQTEMKKLQKDKDECLDEAFQHVMSLEQIALNVDSVSTYVHLDVLIEKMKENGNEEKVKKLEEIKRRMEQDKKKSKAQRFMTSAAAKAGAANVFGAGKKVLGI